jgi:hypothetical protein
MTCLKEKICNLSYKTFSKELLGGEGNYYPLLPKEFLSKLVLLVFPYICFPSSNILNGH